MLRSDLELIQELDMPFVEVARIRRAICKNVLPEAQTVRSHIIQGSAFHNIH